jgi:hypothetical protein
LPCGICICVAFCVSVSVVPSVGFVYFRSLAGGWRVAAAGPLRCLAPVGATLPVSTRVGQTPLPSGRDGRGPRFASPEVDRSGRQGQTQRKKRERKKRKGKGTERAQGIARHPACFLPVITTHLTGTRSASPCRFNSLVLSE